MNNDQLATNASQSDRRLDIAALLVIAAVWLVFFWPLFTPVETQRVQLEPGDFTQQFLVFRQFGLDELRQRRWPLWLPCIDSGYPYFADPQAASFYPPVVLNWAVHVLSGSRTFSIGALELEAALHVLLAALTAYGFLRGEARSRGAALLGALAFSFGGYLLGYPVLQLAILETAAWLPLVMWSMRRLAVRGDARSVVVAGCVWAIGALAGHPQSLVMMGYAGVAYFAFGAWQGRLRARRAVGLLSTTALLALLLSAIQLLPTFEFMRLSSRAELSLDAAGTGFPVSDLVQLVAPGSVSRYSPLYIGLLPLALVAFAIGTAIVKRVRRDARASSAHIGLWAGVALVALLISFGNHTPVFSALYYLAPGFRLFRDQERHALIVVWALSVLAAYGADGLWTASAQSLRRWVSIGFVVIVVIDLAANTRSVNWVPMYDPFPAPAALMALEADALSDTIFRLHSEQRLPGHAACVAGLSEVGGITPIHIAAYQDFIKQVPREVRWSLLNVRYVVTWRSALDGHLGQPIESALLWQQGEGSDAAYVYRLAAEHPRAWIVHEVIVKADRGAIYAALGEPDFNPRRTALALAPIEVVPNQVVEPIQITRLEPNQVIVEATLTTPGLLVVSEANYPGWMATVDGVGQPVIEVNGAFRGVALKTGTSRVQLTFQPVSLWVGGAISTLALLGCIAGLIWQRGRKG
ncbi:MAG: YfhO family protein [Chloroflexi bacterium]|nr:YfhO family protein [Chloroflexota bacterium]